MHLFVVMFCMFVIILHVFAAILCHFVCLCSSFVPLYGCFVFFKSFDFLTRSVTSQLTGCGTGAPGLRPAGQFCNPSMVYCQPFRKGGV